MSKRTVELDLATPGLDARGQPVRVRLGVGDAPDATPPEPDLTGEHMLINLGPQHPATHGVLPRVGGMMADIPDDFVAGLSEFTQTFPRTLSEIDRVLTRNGVWVGRTQGVGALTAAEAINHSLSGPMLRASGVPYDVRRDQPYLDYETYDFDVVVGEHGDVYDRYLVRLEECSQSNRILQQALVRLPDGPVNVADPRVILPPKSRAMNDMEAMIYHFKQVMEGVKAPVGEAYVGIENPKGELGNYLVSDGSAKPVRWRIRPPSFINLSALSKMAEGHLLSDLIAINASVDIVMGEVDR